MTDMLYQQSDDISALAAALAAAQGEIENARKSATNPHFKSRYADLADVREAIRAPFATHGLAVLQMPVALGDGTALVTTLTHKSGQWIRGAMPIGASANQPQAVGSWITYARRYALAALAGLASEDDDGNAAHAHAQSQSQNQRPRYATPGPAPSKYPVGVKDYHDMLVPAVNGANDAWRREQRAAGVKPADTQDLVNSHQAHNHLVTAAINAGYVAPEDVEIDGKRDRAKARAAMGRLMVAEPERLAETLRVYLEGKAEDAKAAKAICDPNCDYPPEPGMHG